MRRWLAVWVNEEEGSTAIEYAMLATIVAIIAIGAMHNFGQASSSMFQFISSSVASASAS